MTAWDVTVSVLSKANLPPASIDALSYVHVSATYQTGPAWKAAAGELPLLLNRTVWQLCLYSVLCMIPVLLDKDDHITCLC